jgi:DNA-binding LacI/PurR family transcriptional regulator
LNKFPEDGILSKVRVYAGDLYDRPDKAAVHPEGAVTDSLTNLGQRFTPKYLDLAQRLLRDMSARGLQPGDLLSTESELAQQHSVSRSTVRQALGILQKAGYLRRQRARGTFVSRAVDASLHRELTRGTVVLACSNEQTVHLDEDFAFATVLRAMERKLAGDGFAVQILGFSNDEPEDRERLTRCLKQEHVQGLCAIGGCVENYRAALNGLPLVSSCTFYPLAGPWVGQDVKEACRASVAHLLARGHRDIALLCSSTIDQHAFAVFVSGYRDAFDLAKLPFKRRLLYHAYSGESLVELAQELLAAADRPTAIFAENWRVAQAIVSAASKVGLKIPRDLSIVAYGQNALHVPLDPLGGPVHVTAYVPNGERIGEEAAKLLTSLVDNSAAPSDPIFIPGQLYERESVAAPPWPVSFDA